MFGLIEVIADVAPPPSSDSGGVPLWLIGGLVGAVVAGAATFAKNRKRGQ
jgi:hypothetical protein